MILIQAALKRENHGKLLFDGITQFGQINI